MVVPALGLRYDVIDGHIAEWEHDLASATNTFLAAIERVSVRLVAGKVSLIRPTRYVRSVVNIKEQSHFLLQS